MYRLKKLSVQGFRGFREPQEFCFDAPANILFGENHSGKSSTLNAIEWCLFGADCIGKQTGIRERIGWPVCNQHMPAPNVSVQLELANAKDSIVVRRELRREKKRNVEKVNLCSSNGEELNGRQAEQYLSRELQSAFRDFMTTAYQHQEAIRAILTQEPKDRDDAIDRLLGLSVFRNLLDAVAKSKVKDKQKVLEQQFTGFEREVEAAFKTRHQDLAQLQKQAREAGIADKQQNARHAVDLARQLCKRIDGFTREMGMTPRPVHAPEEGTDIPKFDSTIRQVIEWLRSEMPAIKEQQKVFQRQSALAKLYSDYQERLKEQSQVAEQLRNLEGEWGNQKVMQNKVKSEANQITGLKDRLRQINAKGALVREALQFMAALNDDAKKQCPLCENSTANLEDVLREQWQKLQQREVSVIETEISNMEKQQAAIEEQIGRHKNLVESKLRVGEKISGLRQHIAQQLGRNLGEENDALVLLRVELNNLESQQQELQNAVQQKQQILSEFQEEVKTVQLISDILGHQNKLAALDKIQESAAFHKMQELRDELATFVTDLDCLQQATSAAAKHEAADKVQTAENSIDRYFRKLACHPAVEGIRLHVAEGRSGRNSYEVTDQSGIDLTPLLSQGDLNALALAIFLGLAAAGSETSPFGFILLDDPSQSLGAGHKERLVQALDEICEQKIIVVATMDKEFHRLLNNGLTKTKAQYYFGAWTPETGPNIKRVCN